MNKEIESLLEINETIITREQRKEHRTLRNDETVLLMNNIKIKEYIQELEFQNTALKAEHNHNIDKIKELEQKESILDKVTDKLKEDANKKIPLAEDMDWVRCRKEYAREILNIIEGEKKMENEEIELKEEELLFIKSLESKLNVTEYSELRNTIEKYVKLARNKDWEVRRYEERFENMKKRADENYSKYTNIEKEKNKWRDYYTEVCNKYAELEIELDLAKAKINILEGEKK